MSKKNKVIKSGDYGAFFHIALFLNKCALVRTFKLFCTLDFFAQTPLYKIYTSNTTKKRLKDRRTFFNIKLKNVKTSCKPLNALASLHKTFEPVKHSTIKYSSSSIAKFINNNTNYSVYFLRKNKSFNKGRYSRNRQNYRTGVY